MRMALAFATAAAISLGPFHAPPAAAEVIPAPPHERSIVAVDGRTLVVGHGAEQVERVASGPLATRTALVDNQAYARLTGRGRTRLTGAELAVGYHVGCAVALAEISAGIRSLLSAIGVSVGEGRPSTIVVKPDESLSLSENSSSVYPGVTIEPGATVLLESGSIADIRMATAQVRNGRAEARIRRTSISVEGCIGPAAIRSYAVLTTESALADESVVVYGEPVLL